MLQVKHLGELGLNYLSLCQLRSEVLDTDEFSPDHQYLTSLAGQTLYQAAPLTIHFTLDFTTAALYRSALLQTLVGNCSEEYRSVRKLNNKQRQVVMFLLLFKLSSQLSFVSFSFSLYPLSAPFLNPFSSPFPHFS